MIYMKQAQTPAVSRHITDPAVRELLPARGPPHGDLAARPAGARRPVAGLDRAGRRRASWSPRSRRTRWTWTGRDIDDPEEIAAVVADLGRATATMHAAADDESGHSLVPFSTERAIDAAIAADEEGFARAAGGLRAQLRRPGAGRPPDLRGPVPQRPDPGPVTASGRRAEPSSQGPFRDRLQAPVGHSPRRWTYPGRSSEPLRAALFTALVVTLVRRVPCAAVPGPAAADHRRRCSRPPSSSSRTPWRAASAASGGSPAC